MNFESKFTFLFRVVSLSLVTSYKWFPKLIKHNQSFRKYSVILNTTHLCSLSKEKSTKSQSGITHYVQLPNPLIIMFTPFGNNHLLPGTKVTEVGCMRSRPCYNSNGLLCHTPPSECGQRTCLESDPLCKRRHSPPWGTNGR